MKLVEKPAKFISDVSQEMSKVSWPSYEDLKGSTLIVVVLSLILAIYIFSSDTILKNIIQLIF
jgi:preprotein translocase subunit SecE